MVYLGRAPQEIGEALSNDIAKYYVLVVRIFLVQSFLMV